MVTVTIDTSMYLGHGKYSEDICGKRRMNLFRKFEIRIDTMESFH